MKQEIVISYEVASFIFRGIVCWVRGLLFSQPFRMFTSDNSYFDSWKPRYWKLEVQFGKFSLPLSGDSLSKLHINLPWMRLPGKY